ncbi:InvB/SpaK family type III secretion system chaperone [Serratia silvae]|uniref:SPI-1 type III secretion system chaperone SpaK n=1 Tax=Serratia silvae TaxID=2824122 RepID=A0ABT0K9X2_9GAMM|nr:SPI-1 type III secretion system chaperone SpaK [Serratia silvae]MCL1028797.1 SPI-1 type III secretion system chaperone SpaK [Serratia silvae]
MSIDIAILLREALTESGCQSDVMGDFDSHSTIALEFDGHPGILITQLQDEVWIWSRLIEDNGLTISQCSAALLEKLMQGCEFAANGQLQLASNEGFVELKGLVHAQYLETSAKFASALDEFFALSEDFCRIYQ